MSHGRNTEKGTVDIVLGFCMMLIVMGIILLEVDFGTGYHIIGIAVVVLAVLILAIRLIIDSHLKDKDDEPR